MCRYYDHALTQIEKGKLLDELDRITSPSSHQGVKPDHKDNRLFSILQVNSSKIVDEDGEPMKAPNGKKSNLNEREWLQVRTNKFKEWFGDWEKAAEIASGLNILQSFVSGKTGLLGNVNNAQIGSINVYSGKAGSQAKQYKDGYGLEHIIARRILEGNNVAETLFGINKALVKGRKVREYGGENGRIELQYGDYIAIVSKQRFGNKEQWQLTGFKIKSDAERESYNPQSYAPYSSVSRNKAVADLSAKLQQKIENANNHSKIIDENGEPMKVYHGSRKAGFSEFLTDDGREVRKGSFFAKSREVAAEYADSDKSTEITGTVNNNGIYDIFLNIRNPLKVEWGHGSWYDTSNADLSDELREAGIKTIDQLSVFAKNNGYGGVVVSNIKDHLLNTIYTKNPSSESTDVFIAFNPNQIKSATDNNGNFDDESGDIRFQVAENNPAAHLENSENNTNFAEDFYYGKGKYKTRLGDRRTMAHDTIREALGVTEKRDGIYRTLEAADNRGSEGAVSAYKQAQEFGHNIQRLAKENGVWIDEKQLLWKRNRTNGSRTRKQCCE
ncbi:MAG: hypothetical protein LBQ31_03510 [Bacteroidales bacterium]|jgi:hypothetical protein|nr:hypothetical protein [Bacteroidales bacterium]